MPVTCRQGVSNPGNRVAAWTMSETTGEDHEGHASPSEGASTQDGPEPARGDRGHAAQDSGRDHSQACLQDRPGHAGRARHVGGVKKSADGFVLPNRYRREGSSMASFMYSGNLCYSIAPALGVQISFVVGDHLAKKCRHGVSLTENCRVSWVYVRSNILAKSTGRPCQ